MTFGIRDEAFKKAVYTSLIAHIALFIFILVSPSLPRPTRKGMIHYVPIDLLAGGGGGGGGLGTAGKPGPPPAKKETLRDLTTPQKAVPETKPEMSYPVDKPKKTEPKKAEKKASISQAEPAPKTAPSETAGSGESGTGMGTGLRIGSGTGGGGGGFGPGGPGYGSGLANFPYTYYLNIITDRVSANWFSSLVDPGVAGNFQTIIFFKIQKNGQVTDIFIEQSSGITPLDLSALRAVKASAPFPPLPRDYQDAYLGIHLIFEHSK